MKVFLFLMILLGILLFSWKREGMVNELSKGLDFIKHSNEGYPKMGTDTILGLLKLNNDSLDALINFLNTKSPTDTIQKLTLGKNLNRGAKEYLQQHPAAIIENILDAAREIKKMDANEKLEIQSWINGYDQKTMGELALVIHDDVMGFVRAAATPH